MQRISSANIAIISIDHFRHKESRNKKTGKQSANQYERTPCAQHIKCAKTKQHSTKKQPPIPRNHRQNPLPHYGKVGRFASAQNNNNRAHPAKTAEKHAPQKTIIRNYIIIGSTPCLGNSRIKNNSQQKQRRNKECHCVNPPPMVLWHHHQYSEILIKQSFRHLPMIGRSLVRQDISGGMDFAD